MRQIDILNDELQVGYDRMFEERWRRAELLGRAVMLLVVLAALAGLLGRGPFSHHSLRSPDGTLVVDFEPVARSGTDTQITLHLSPAACQEEAAIWLNGNFVEPMGLSGSQPMPLRSEARPDGVVIHVGTPRANCRDTMIRLFAKPTGAGPVRLQARLLDDPDGRAALAWTQLVLP
ncbi:hypothetical protein [Rhizosaccharibacter radicis]|uniref:Uncharacterized protein n=1 Tax=Rhizosaccharibacter radicis TaxID=2782605 RepID=A0ABT1VX56_9PROT|nr:hypothetical protein [Acetobacteraceae bacterium KSS12]